MMIQYLSIKEQHRDAVLFFRLGDFYEMFNEDAVEVSRLLSLTLTQRAGNPMCGIPFHASKSYIARLLRAGKKIAICEQLSIPGPGKGLAERKVVEVITPGTAIEEDYLNQARNNYLASLSVVDGDRPVFGFAYIDVTTGEFGATSFGAADFAERFRKETGRIEPCEMLVQQSILGSHPEAGAILGEYPAMVVNKFPDWSYGAVAARKRLCAAFGTESLKAFDLDDASAELPAAGLLLEYLERTAGPKISHVTGIRVYGDGDFVSIDDSTRKNLELDRNLRDGSQSYTLLEVLDCAKTAMGSRLLRSWIHHPLTDSRSIAARLGRVRALYRSQKTLARARDVLSGMLDIERLCARVAMDRAHGRDLVALGKSLEAFLSLDRLATEELASVFDFGERARACAREVADLISRSIEEDCPVALNEGGIIRPEWSKRLDELRALRDDSNAVLDAYLEEERERTGIQNLRIRYNRLIGYYLEVSKGNLSSVPSHFIRRRSLANGDRYTTDRLVELETELNGAHAGIIECEQELFGEIRKTVFAHIRDLGDIAREVAGFDVIQSFAWCATQNAWTEPSFSDSGILRIENGRHPVVEAHLPSGEFVPNGITLSSGGTDRDIASFALITGPNMAGKSTFLRQTALIVLMAQIGSFVPAQEAELSVVDKIFCRVGASDNLARGESTFLVEMTETAHILRNATEKSLVIMDEVGRGTSTEDGLSIAQAVTEYLLRNVGAKTLFATHYHELSRLALKGMADYCLDVLETEGTVVFLKKVREGASANSYGIHVARLAGIPEPVLARAREILADGKPEGAIGNPAMSGSVVPTAADANVAAHETSSKRDIPERQLFSEEDLVIADIASLDVDRLTPLEALKRIDGWKRKLQS
jgi:DNA mismatch repair protein MutS